MTAAACRHCGRPIRAGLVACSTRCAALSRPYPVAPRFWSRVSKDAPRGCWEWTGQIASTGYGAMSVHNRPVGAHRVSWELHHGAIPDGLWVLHRCDNRRCVNPAHLFLGTATDNARDMVAKGRANPYRRPEVRARGERVGGAKLTAEAVVAIRRRRSTGDTFQAIALDYGVSRHSIAKAVNCRTWAHINPAEAA